jgi:hypothetical protein
VFIHTSIIVLTALIYITLQHIWISGYKHSRTSLSVSIYTIVIVLTVLIYITLQHTCISDYKQVEVHYNKVDSYTAPSRYPASLIGRVQISSSINSVSLALVSFIGHANVSHTDVHSTTLMTVMVTLRCSLCHFLYGEFTENVMRWSKILYNAVMLY